MHYSWCIWKHWQGVSPVSVPAFAPNSGEAPIDIQWVHKAPGGSPDLVASIDAAHAMVVGYSISNLQVPPALNSNHIQGKALDMVVSWNGTLSIKDKTGAVQHITTAPRDGTNAHLINVGETYGVHHLVDVMADPPHWSFDGH
jgi:hypothetical protein